MEKVPIGVKIISVLYYIGAALLLISGLIFLFGSGALGVDLNQVLEAYGLGAVGTIGFIIVGITYIGFAVLFFFIGRGLWKAQNWARIVAIILAVLAIINSLFVIVVGRIVLSSVINIILSAIIGGYLWFNKSVKQTFK